MFDWDLFERMVEVEYQEIEPGWELDEFLDVFYYFFEQYRHKRGEEHPPLKPDQIRRILQHMPDSVDGAFFGLGAVDYPSIIDEYFKADFRGCDYRINHFMAGRVREIQYRESLRKQGNVFDSLHEAQRKLQLRKRRGRVNGAERDDDGSFYD